MAGGGNDHQRKGRPFGAVLVKDDQIVVTGVNTVLSNHDPTVHAEMEAIRAVSRRQQNERLGGQQAKDLVAAWGGWARGGTGLGTRAGIQGASTPDGRMADSRQAGAAGHHHRDQ